jgi:3-deoxy-manno-octulosonate cytidylyltransferase (CMP-KDO synthetase)
MSHTTAILIPARMASTRLPGKPLADIAGKPMIVHVMERAAEAGVGQVYVACAEQRIADAVKEAGGRAILTKPEHPCGTDRIYEALSQLDPEQSITRVINLQGDLPTLEPHLIREVHGLLDKDGVDIATLAARINDPMERGNPNVVKAVFSLKEGQNQGRALYFTRASAPYGGGALYHHIGIYAYTRDAIERFVKLPPSPLEEREKLEQLRALEEGMHIEVGVAETVPLGVDTPEDLEKARKMLEALV